MDLIYFNARTKPETKILFKISLLFSFYQMYICADLVYTIEEGKRPGTYIGDIATDSNIMESFLPEDKGSIQFNQLQQSDSIFFRVARQTGKLYTSKILDAESICKRNKECFQLLYVMVQKGSFIKTLAIKVNIKDINDNRPRFPNQPININFEEGQEKSMKRSIPKAIDNDISENNSQISYELKNSHGKPFELMVSTDVFGASKLYLVLKEILDRERQDMYTLELIAKDGGSPSRESVLDILVSVTDVNDNAPVFAKNIYRVYIKNEPNETFPIVTVLANDVDIGKNGKISYHFNPRTSQHVKNHFILNEETGEIFLNGALDSDDVLIIDATDKGQPPLSDTTLVYVINITNNPPYIRLYFVYPTIDNKIILTKDMSVGSFIAYMKVEDNDEGHNGDVSCHLHHDKFQLQNLGTKKYEVTLKNPLDREKEEHHDVVISCQDKGSPPLHSNSKFSIQVMDINDVSPKHHLSTTVCVDGINMKNNPPVIKYTLVTPPIDNKIYVSEDMVVGSVIALVDIIDNDQGPNGDVYCFFYHDKFQLQTISKNEGINKYQVILKNPLDREKEEHHDVVISCQDKGSPPLHSNSKFSIQVMDINDVRPQFTKDTFKFFIDENQNSRITLGYINATDPDLGDGGKLTYSLITNNNKHFLPFKITTNGLLSAIMSLDHEFQHTYHFKVFVKDNGTPSLNNTVNVIVEVTDKNDNAPYFTFPSVKPYNLHVTYYPDARNKNITQIKAADSDSQENAFLKYQIIRGNDKQMFTINQYTGFLAFNRQLSQQNAGSYQLDILVKDSGRPVLSATTTLILTLTISNNTSEMLNVVQLHTEEKVHLNLVIIITVIAVTIAVFITASLSICIIRCNGQSNVAYAQALDPSKRYIGEQRQLIPSPYQVNSWPRPAHLVQPDQDLARNTPTQIRSPQSHTSGQKPHGSADVTSQMYTQNLSIPPDYFGDWRSHQAEIGHASRDEDNEAFSKDFNSSKSLIHPSHVDKRNISAPFPQSRNLIEMNNEQTSNTRPLPPVPHT